MNDMDINKKLFSYGVFFVLINLFIVFNAGIIASLDFYENVDSLYVDGADFSLLFNVFGSIFSMFFSAMFGFVIFIVDIIIILIATNSFSKSYVKNLPEDKDDLYNNLRKIATYTILGSIILIILFNLKYDFLFVISGIMFYIPFPFIIYFMTKNKLNKVYNKVEEQKNGHYNEYGEKIVSEHIFKIDEQYYSDNGHQKTVEHKNEESEQENK